MESSIIQVHQGQLRGVKEKNINRNSFFAFRGIPYAKAPIGNLRFKDCEPPVPWSGVRNATKFSNRCAQQDWTNLEIYGSDDCLYLNVYTAIIDTSKLKPVMVWIHGGSFICGSGDDLFFGPDYLIEKDIVLVTINYRVGILGFLNADDEEAPGNQGLKDQVQALKWIQQNISQFGGDPNNVTIFGESAGGASVHYLSVSPLTEGLFHKVIIQSGVATNPWATWPKSLLEPIQKLASLLNKDTSDMKEFINYLRTLDAQDLVRAEKKILTRENELQHVHPFVPSVDLKAKNPFLTKPIVEAVKIGIRVPCVCGYVSHEGLVAVLPDEIYNEINADHENLLIHPIVLQYLKLYNITVEDFRKFYLHDEKIISMSNYNFIDLSSAIHFIIGIEDVIRIQSQFLNVPMYVYKFEYEVEMSITKKLLNINLKGTCHGDELAFLFYSNLARNMGRQTPPFGSSEHRLIQIFTEMWSNFAKTGNPTPQKTNIIPITWESIDGSTANYKYLKITEKLAMDVKKNIIQQLIESKNYKP